MKSIIIALKDMGRAFRSMFALAFMFGVPILMTLIFFFLFGGTLGGDEPAFTLPKTDVMIVNLDEGHEYLTTIPTETGEANNMGELLIQVLQDDTFKDLFTITPTDEPTARQAVDAQESGMAIILPPDLTTALIGQGDQSASIEFYKDPELSLGPQIVKSIVMNIVDNLSSPSLSLDAVTAALKAEGVNLNQQEQIALITSLSQQNQQSGENAHTNLTIVPPAENEAPENTFLTIILRGVMGGMMIFYAFFTGTSSAQTILQEEENGTLARLLISPTATRTILNGKILAGFLMISVQVVVLIVFANLIFHIHWGPTLLLLIAAAGLVICANCFGIFIMSLVKSTKQAGGIFGSVLTLSGMLGISSVFTGGTPIEKAFDFLPLLVPQGWAMRAFEAVWSANLLETLLFTGGMLAWSLVFFIIGNMRFKKRLA